MSSITVDVHAPKGKKAGTAELPGEIFDVQTNIPLIHQVVVAQLAAARQGTHSTKTRGEVRGGGSKPWRQKGTGRARAGMTSSPLWRGGGRIFPNKPDENFSQKVNRKMYRAGMRSILSQLVREDRLSVVESLKLEAPKTKLLVGKLNGMGLKSTLIVVDNEDENLYLAARNLPHVLVLETRHIDPLSLVHYDNVLVTKQALAQIQEMLG